MTQHGTPILYLNMGGEMLYVFRQRLKAQQISNDKATQVLDEVTAALLNPKILGSIFTEAPLMGISMLRATLECVALSSIMKLDQNSMNKLFDLMITMVKYQLTVATGPREIILLTLNHTDAMRDMVKNPSAQHCVGLVHQMVIDFYGSLTYEEVWNARNDCLKELGPYCVRVSILLRLGLQNDDCSFALSSSKYNEKYEEKANAISQIKLLDVESADCVGSFNLFGDRVTELGRNMYTPIYESSAKISGKQSNQNFLRNCGAKAELGMLAVQLGTEETTYKRPFTLNLFANEENEDITKDKVSTESNENDDGLTMKSIKLNEDYKNKLDNVYADFVDDEEEEGIIKRMDLLELLDKIE